MHVKTFHSSSFALSGDPVVSDVETVQLTFTRPIDVKKTQVVLTNTKTKKTVGIDHIESSKDDMRVISLILSKKIEEGVQYDLMLKKVTTQAGTELPAENKTPLKIVYNSQNTPTVNNSIIDAPVVTQDVPQETTFDKPVPIDKLPQTGPREILFFFLIAA